MYAGLAAVAVSVGGSLTTEVLIDIAAALLVKAEASCTVTETDRVPRETSELLE